MHLVPCYQRNHYFSPCRRYHNGMTFTEDSDLNGSSHQFTFTCISTGGPATTVTWTRHSGTVTQGSETVLDDPVTAQYTHTLTVTGRQTGLYTCTVANDKPSNDLAQLNVRGNLTYTKSKALPSHTRLGRPKYSSLLHVSIYELYLFHYMLYSGYIEI